MVKYCLMLSMCRVYVSWLRRSGPTDGVNMLFSMFIFVSNHAPKFLAQFEGKMVALSTFIDRPEGILLMSMEEKNNKKELWCYLFVM